MALKDDVQAITILPLDGSGFTVTVIKFVKDEAGEYVLDENGNRTQESDVHGFTNFVDAGAFIIQVNEDAGP